jgi:hypothetical protein
MRITFHSSPVQTSRVDLLNFFLRFGRGTLTKRSAQQPDGIKPGARIATVGNCIRVCLLLCCFSGAFAAPPARAQEPSDNSSATAQTRRDGQHDFDFEIGTWKTHLKASSRLRHPFTGPVTWTEYEGTSVVRKIWNGKANMVELTVDGPTGHFEALNLHLYNPDSHQWSLNFANSKVGIMSVPTVGEFKDGRGEFYDQETIDGRVLLVRNVWSDITPDSCHFEQAFSEDGGKTWELNWIVTDTRVKD